jgi:hypothetical protein
MFKLNHVCAAALAATLALPALAQTAGAKEQIRAALRSQLIPIMGDSSKDIVTRLLTVRPDAQISQNFNLARLYSEVFGRNGGVAAADCRVNVTPVGEPEAGDCRYEQGKRDDPTAAYATLSFSRNIGLGNVSFAKRPAFVVGGADPQPIRLTDATAYQAALRFADLAGLPKSEIPTPPANAQNPLPVRSLVVGAGQQRGQTSRIEVQKVVSLQRAFVVPGGLFRDPATGVIVQHAIAPGRAVIAIDDQGVNFARIEGWSDAQLDPKLNASLAKSVSDLVDEITDDLYNEGVRKVGTLSVLIGLRQAIPNPDDPNPPRCPACGVLRPAVKVAISQLGSARSDTSASNFAAPGLVREYDLVAATELERPAR